MEYRSYFQDDLRIRFRIDKEMYLIQQFSGSDPWGQVITLIHNVKP